MKKRTLVFGAIGVIALVAVAAATRSWWSPEGANAQAQRAAPPRVVPIDIAQSVVKPMPVRVEALGTVMPIATVTTKPRIDSEVTGVHFDDGALVKTGDLLFTLDSRAIEAQIKQAEGNIERDKAQIEGADRDVKRYTDLVAKGATPVINLDNAKTAASTFRGALMADEGALENLKVLLSYCTIRAPISGKISAATVKIGNFVRTGSDMVQLATINQIAPIYVAFGVPQRLLPNIREAVDAKTAKVEAIVLGQPKNALGEVTMIDNTVDQTTGMVTIRATMPNADQILWPGALVTVQLTLRIERAVVVPSVAVQVGQSGNFVFVVKDGAASVRPVKVARVIDAESVISEGLAGDETVVVDGQLLLNNGTKVSVRGPKAGS
jgi:membrane fusion protein, multidrug efflux system